MERVEGMEGVEGKMIASVLAKAIPIDPSITDDVGNVSHN
jgi:hypothetical protein